MREKVEKALETIRPALQADGGDVELVDVIDGVARSQQSKVLVVLFQYASSLGLLMVESLRI